MGVDHPLTAEQIRVLERLPRDGRWVRLSAPKALGILVRLSRGWPETPVLVGKVNGQPIFWLTPYGRAVLAELAPEAAS